MVVTTRSRSVAEAATAANVEKGRDECDNDINLIIGMMADDVSKEDCVSLAIETLSARDLLKAQPTIVQKLKRKLISKGVEVPSGNCVGALLTFLENNGGDVIQSTLSAANQETSTAGSIRTGAPTPFHDPRKDRFEFMKAYNDKSTRFSGDEGSIAFVDWYQDLVQNFKVFEISDDKSKADMLPKTLDGKAKNFMRTVDTEASFEDLIASLKKEFVSDSLQMQSLDAFRSLTFADVRKRNVGFSDTEVFEKFISQLRALQKNVSPEYQSDLELKNNILRGMKETRYQKYYIHSVSERSEGLVNKIKLQIQSMDTPGSEQGKNDLFFQGSSNAEHEFDIHFQRALRRYGFSKNPSTRPQIAHPVSKSKYLPRNFNWNKIELYSDKKNPIGRDGKVMVCDVCKSEMHLRGICPHRPEARIRAFYTFTDESGTQNSAEIQTEDAPEMQESREPADEEADLTGRLLDNVDCYTMFHVEVHKNVSDSGFKGYCIDSACPVSSCGIEQFKAYCKATNSKVDVEPSNTTVTWGRSIKSLGRAKIRFPIDRNHVFEFYVELLSNSNIPLMFGLDTLEALGITLIHDKDNPHMITGSGIKIPLEKKECGHYFRVLNDSPDSILLMYTEPELEKFHRRFGHPETSRIIRLIEQSGHIITHEEKSLLEKVRKKCVACQVYAQKPGHAQLSTDVTSLFNHHIFIDLMYIETKAVLHIVCAGTRYQRAAFVSSKSSEHMWDCVLKLWVFPLLGFPHMISVDSGSEFKSAYVKEMCEMYGIILDVKPVEAHFSVGLVERYHKPLRTIFLKIRAAEMQVSPSGNGDSQQDNERWLWEAVSSINNVSGPEGLTPNILVFGTTSKLLLGSGAHTATHKERIRTALTARSFAESMMADLKLKAAQNQKLGVATPKLQDQVVTPGAWVLVYREKQKRFCGPYLCADVQGSRVSVFTPPLAQISTFHINSCKVFTGNVRTTETVISQEQVPDNPILYTSSEMTDYQEAIQDEVRGLFDRGVFQLIDEGEANQIENPRVFNGRFVLVTKPDGRRKARFVVQGFGDPDKDSLVIEAPVLTRLSMRSIIVIATIKNWEIHTRDITQAYVQSTAGLWRNVLLRIPKTMEKFFIPYGNNQAHDSDNMLLQLKKPLYGLTESGTCWWLTYSTEYQKSFTRNTWDPCVFLFPNHGIAGLVVDDSILVGDSKFLEKEACIAKKYKNSGRKPIPVMFNGIQIERQNEYLILHQSAYHEKNIREKLLERDKRSFLGAVGWLAFNTRPELLTDYAIFAQSNDMCRKDREKVLKKSMRNKPMRYVTLDQSSLEIRVYVDASFGSNQDCSSQVGFFVFVCDGNERANLVHWSSHKLKRIVRSVLGAELCAALDAFDIGYCIRDLMQQVLVQDIPLVLVTDSKSLFESLATLKATREKRLLIDLAVMRTAYEKEELRIGWIPGSKNIADMLTKKRSNPGLYESFYDTNSVNHIRPEKYVDDTRHPSHLLQTVNERTELGVSDEANDVSDMTQPRDKTQCDEANHMVVQ